MGDETKNMTPEQMATRIAELEGRLAKGGSINFKVSDEGAFPCMVSVAFRSRSI